MNSSLFVLHSSLNLLLVQNFQLLANTLLVDVLENLSGKLRAHAAEGSLGTTLVENLVVTASLNDGHVVLLLVGTNLAANAHTQPGDPSAGCRTRQSDRAAGADPL